MASYLQTGFDYQYDVVDKVQLCIAKLVESILHNSLQTLLL